MTTLEAGRYFRERLDAAQTELAALKAERTELREALRLLLRADQMPPSEQQAGLAIAAMSHARAVLAKGKSDA